MRLIFLDLDRTLLGDDYAPEPALPLINRLRQNGFVIVLNSSKTRFEQEFYRKAWNLEEPFIVENGSAVYIPQGYFDFEIPASQKIAHFFRIKLGVDYQKIVEVLRQLETKFELKYYGNSSVEEVVKFTGLPPALASLAMKREFSETIFYLSEESVIDWIEKQGLKVMKGSRFYSVTGNVDKGKAASVLIELFEREAEVISYAIGDGENDLPLFDVVDHAFVIGTLRHPKAISVSDAEEAIKLALRL